MQRFFAFALSIAFALTLLGVWTFTQADAIAASETAPLSDLVVPGIGSVVLVFSPMAFGVLAVVRWLKPNAKRPKVWTLGVLGVVSLSGGYIGVLGWAVVVFFVAIERLLPVGRPAGRQAG